MYRRTKYGVSIDHARSVPRLLLPRKNYGFKTQIVTVSNQVILENVVVAKSLLMRPWNKHSDCNEADKWKISD